MKLDDYISQVTQAQMQAFANQLRKATASGLSVVIVGGDITDESGQCAACALSFDDKLHRNSGKAELEASFVMLKTAATIIHRVTQGTVKVQLNGPEGPFPVDSGDVRAYTSSDDATTHSRAPGPAAP